MRHMPRYDERFNIELGHLLGTEEVLTFFAILGIIVAGTIMALIAESSTDLPTPVLSGKSVMVHVDDGRKYDCVRVEHEHMTVLIDCREIGK